MPLESPRSLHLWHSFRKLISIYPRSAPGHCHTHFPYNVKSTCNSWLAELQWTNNKARHALSKAIKTVDIWDIKKNQIFLTTNFSHNDIFREIKIHVYRKQQTSE